MFCPGCRQNREQDWYYTSCVDEVKALKRNGDLDSATKLLLKAIKATEAEAKAKGWAVAPWYFRQLAIIYRKQKNYSAEREILERYLRHIPRDTEAKERLKKVQSLIDAIGQAAPTTNP
jgi:tetratricopeptide (TPR) repeat protein